jgi:PAS domain S-box-containing protein
MGLIQSGWWSVGNIIISPLAGMLATATVVLTIPLYIFSKGPVVRWTALISYLLMYATASVMIITTGHTDSPFILLWMLLTIFAGLFGILGFLFISVVDAAYVTYLYADQPAGPVSLSIVLFTFVVPLVLSLIVWRKQGFSETKSDKAYSDLAKELSQVANKSEIVINGIADGVIAVNDSGTIQLINPAAQSIMGWGKQDALELDYRSVFRLTDSKDKPVIDENDPIQQVLKSNVSITRNDLSLITSAGKKMVLSLLISPVGQQGSGAIIVFRDITSDVAENRQKAEFVSTASHEMRTPVAAIEGYIGLALNPQTASIDDKARVYLTKAHESAQHLGQLFQDLLDVSKAEDGRLNNNPVPTDATSFIRDVATSMLSTAISKQITLTFAPDQKVASNQNIAPAYYVNADPNHFREVVSNLIENAIKYTKPAGTVTVDISGDESHVTVSIVDSGIGIPAEDITHLFQKFYRVDNTDTREIGGTGLGLYLCRRLVETMDGRIWVESVYGKGSMFFVELPRMNTQDALQRISPPVTPTDSVAPEQPAPPTITPTA